MMIKYFITFACIWLSMPLCGNAQEVEWVKLITGSIINTKLGHMDINNEGNILFSQTFAPDTLLTIDGKVLNFTNYGVTDFFISNIKNNIVSGIKLPQIREQHTLAGLTMDDKMNCFILGEYSNLAIFDSVVLDKSGQKKGYGMFLVGYDTSLKLSWAYPISYYNNNLNYLGFAQGKAIATDKTSLYIAGVCGGGVIANKDTLNCRAFVIKTDLNGNNEWVKRIQGNLSSLSVFNYGMRLAVQQEVGKNIVFAANVENQGSITLDSTILHSKEKDILISLFDSLGNLVWANILGGSNMEIMSDVKIKNSIVYLSGFTSGDMYLNNELLIRDSATFVVALDVKDGKKLWVKNYGKKCGYPSLAISENYLFVCIDFWDTLSSYRRYISNRNKEAQYSSDILVEQLNTNGDAVFGFQVGNGKGSKKFPVIGLDSLNNLYLLCSFVGSTDILGTSLYADYGSFLAKIKLPTLSVKNETTNEHKNNLQVLESDEMIKIKLPYKPYKSLLSCYNSIGEKLFTKNITPLTEVIELSKSTFTNGKYFCTIEHDGIAETISFVVQR